MRVVWLALEWPREDHHPGGVGRYVWRLAEAIRNDVDLTVICFADALQMDGVHLVAVKVPRGRLSRYYSSSWAAARFTRQLKHDVLHLHGDDLFVRVGPRQVRSYYGSSLEEARTSHGLRRLNHYLLALGEARSVRKSATRLAIAPESQNRFDCQFVVPPYLKSARVPGFAEPKSADPQVVFIGSYRGKKQGHLVADAMERVRKGHPRAGLVVVGPSDDRENWPEWVDHRAGLDDQEVRALVASSWALAAPSSYEGFGIPLVEALDAGTRVLAFGNPGASFVRSLAKDAAPLAITTPETFAIDLARLLERSPVLLSDEQQAVADLVDELIAQGGPPRILSIYDDVARSSA